MNNTKAKIAFLTFHNALNYGAILQSYALQVKLNELGYKNLIINYSNRYIDSQYPTIFRLFLSFKFIKLFKLLFSLFFFPQRYKRIQKRNAKLIKFIKKNLKLTDKVSGKKLFIKINQFNTVIIGSDQVWNFELTNYDLNYLLNINFNQSIRRISYASSFGNNDYIKKFKAIYFKYLSNFNALSLREESSCNLLQSELGINSTHVIDPTLLLDKNDYEKLIINFKRTINLPEKFILIYLVAEPDLLIQRAINLSKKLNIPIITISLLKKYPEIFYIPDCGIEEFLLIISKAYIIFSTSYHGIMFSLIFNKHFLYELSNNNSNTNIRIIDAAEQFSFSAQQILKNTDPNFEIDWERINALIRQRKQYSVDFLTKNI